MTKITELAQIILKIIYNLTINNKQVTVESIVHSQYMTNGEYRTVMNYLRDKDLIELVWLLKEYSIDGNTYRKFIFRKLTPEGIRQVEQDPTLDADSVYSVMQILGPHINLAKKGKINKTLLKEDCQKIINWLSQESSNPSSKEKKK